MGLRLPLHGPGNNTRRYIHASDLCETVDTILHKGKIGEIYNIASDDEISNIHICEKFLSNSGLLRQKPDGGRGISAGDFEHWIDHTGDRPANDLTYRVDATKLHALGCRPNVDFETGMRDTVDWYKQFGLRWWGGVQDVLGDGNFEMRKFGVAPDADGAAASKRNDKMHVTNGDMQASEFVDWSSNKANRLLSTGSNIRNEIELASITSVDLEPPYSERTVDLLECFQNSVYIPRTFLKSRSWILAPDNFPEANDIYLTDLASHSHDLCIKLNHVRKSYGTSYIIDQLGQCLGQPFLSLCSLLTINQRCL